MGKATFKDAVGMSCISRMTYAVAIPAKAQVNKAIEGTLEDNEKLYKLLEEYDEKQNMKSPKSA